MIVVEAVWGLIPSSFWTQGIWGNLLCGGWFHYCGTCSTEACRSTDLSRDHDLGLVRPLADDTGLTLGGKCSSFFLVSGGGGFLSQFSGGPHPSESIQYTYLG
jgi:hypothetical protein